MAIAIKTIEELDVPQWIEYKNDFIAAFSPSNTNVTNQNDFDLNQN